MICHVVTVEGVQAEKEKAGFDPAKIQNSSVKERIKWMQEAAASSPRNTKPAKTRRKYVRPDPFKQILTGDLEQVSIKDIHRFIDKAREETKQLAGKPKSQHGPSCFCLDHIDFALKRRLAQITADSETYGKSIFVRPQIWSPPFFSHPEPTALHEVVIFAFLSFGVLTMLVLILITFVATKFNQAKRARMGRKKAGLDSESTEPGVEEHVVHQEGFDITRVDIVA